MRTIVTLACMAGFSAWMTLSATPSAAAQSASSTNTSTSTSASTRHVWTNEDLETLRDKTPMPVLGEPPAAAGDTRADADAFAKEQRQREQRAERYRRQLQPLYAELPQIEGEIAEMRRWQDGSYRMTGMWPLRFAGMPLNPADRIAQLEAREREVRERIGSLEDEARHGGVLPGELR